MEGRSPTFASKESTAPRHEPQGGVRGRGRRRVVNFNALKGRMTVQDRQKELEKGSPLISHTPAREDRAPVSAQKRTAKINYVQVIKTPVVNKIRPWSELWNGKISLDEKMVAI